MRYIIVVISIFIFLIFFSKICYATCTCTCGTNIPLSHDIFENIADIETCKTKCGNQIITGTSFFISCTPEPETCEDSCAAQINIAQDYAGYNECVINCELSKSNTRVIPKDAGDVIGSQPKTPTAPAPPVMLTDPLGIGGKAPAGQEVQYLIGRVIKVIMGLVGSIALLMFVYGGFLWMTAAGNDESVKKGKDILIWSVAGLAVIFASYILVYFVLASLMGL
ncbi:MAG: pilin [bacterium]